LDSQQLRHPIEELDKVVEVEELLEAQEAIRHVYVDDLIKEYIISLVSATRSHPDIYLGASPRGSLALYRGGQARAALEGRDFVIPDDIKALAVPMLAHRLIISPSARIKNVEPAALVQELLNTLPVPGARVRAAGRPTR
jgi:MoxR-like ATPase